MNENYWILKAVFSEKTREGLNYYRAVYFNGVELKEELYGLEQFIPTILSKYHFH